MPTLAKIEVLTLTIIEGESEIFRVEKSSKNIFTNVTKNVSTMFGRAPSVFPRRLGPSGTSCASATLQMVELNKGSGPNVQTKSGRSKNRLLTDLYLANLHQTRQADAPRATGHDALPHVARRRACAPPGVPACAYLLFLGA